ncbi:MAG: HD domain-containing protein [Phycisphaerales bacterium]
MRSRVLIVADDTSATDEYAGLLMTEGFVPVVARTAAEARAILEREPTLRMVMSAWQLPDDDGLTLCRWIRRMRPTSYTYFILITVRTGAESVIEGLASGVDEFLEHPVAPLEFAMRVRIGERLLALETRDTLIFALAKLAESRDPDTGLHLERVQRYCGLLAEDLRANGGEDEIDQEFVLLLTLTSALHDIGKVGIPDGVLLKPDRLTAEEYTVMRTHTTIGADTLDAALRHSPEARFLLIARDVARSHHERWDGKGYPDGLRTNAIPLAARIMSVADVYDALTSRRVYKPAMPHADAARAIIEGSGTQFDPAIVASFRRVETQFDEIRKAMQDAAEAHACEAR